MLYNIGNDWIVRIRNDRAMRRYFFRRRAERCFDRIEIRKIIGVIEFDAKVASEDQMMEAAIEAGADDVATSEDGHEVVTSMESLRDVAKVLEDKFGEPRKAGLVWRPQNYIGVDDEAGEKAKRGPKVGSKRGPRTNLGSSKLHQK